MAYRPQYKYNFSNPIPRYRNSYPGYEQMQRQQERLYNSQQRLQREQERSCRQFDRSRHYMRGGRDHYGHDIYLSCESVRIGRSYPTGSAFGRMKGAVQDFSGSYVPSGDYQGRGVSR